MSTTDRPFAEIYRHCNTAISAVRGLENVKRMLTVYQTNQKVVMDEMKSQLEDEVAALREEKNELMRSIAQMKQTQGYNIFCSPNATCEMIDDQHCVSNVSLNNDAGVLGDNTDITDVQMKDVGKCKKGASMESALENTKPPAIEVEEDLLASGRVDDRATHQSDTENSFEPTDGAPPKIDEAWTDKPESKEDATDTLVTHYDNQEETVLCDVGGVEKISETIDPSNTSSNVDEEEEVASISKSVGDDTCMDDAPKGSSTEESATEVQTRAEDDSNILFVNDQTDMNDANEEPVDEESADEEPTDEEPANDQKRNNNENVADDRRLDTQETVLKSVDDDTCMDDAPKGDYSTAFVTEVQTRTKDDSNILFVNDAPKGDYSTAFVTEVQTRNEDDSNILFVNDRIADEEPADEEPADDQKRNNIDENVADDRHLDSQETVLKSVDDDTCMDDAPKGDYSPQASVPEVQTRAEDDSHIMFVNDQTDTNMNDADVKLAYDELTGEEPTDEEPADEEPANDQKRNNNDENVAEDDPLDSQETVLETQMESGVHPYAEVQEDIDQGTRDDVKEDALETLQKETQEFKSTLVDEGFSGGNLSLGESTEEHVDNDEDCDPMDDDDDEMLQTQEVAVSSRITERVSFPPARRRVARNAKWYSPKKWQRMMQSQRLESYFTAPN